MTLLHPSIRRSFLRVSTGLLALCSSLAVAQTPAQRIAAVPDGAAARVALAESLSRRPATSQVLGHLPGDTQLTGMSLMLAPSAAQEAALDKLIADQQNPASSSYHQWLTPAQFGARFGASDADIAILTAWLQARGFSVDSVAPSRNRIVFSGTSSAAESAFGTTLQMYRRGGNTFFENSSAIQLPQAFAGVVTGVTGLTSYRAHAPQAVHKALPAATSASPAYTAGSGSHYLVPGDFKTIFGVKTLISSGYDGTGIKIGVIGQSAVDTSQLTYFQQKTGQTTKLPTLTLVPNSGVSNKVDGDEGESELDLEYASGTAPGASVQFIYTGCTNITSSTVLAATTNCNNNGVFDAMIYAITNNLAPILTLSYGSCETDDLGYAHTTFEPALKQGNAQGQTILVASGDLGAATCDLDDTTSTVTVASQGLSVSYPASSVYVTGVGGTQLSELSGVTYWSSTNNSDNSSALSYIPETSWNDTASYGSLAASGGGVSAAFAKPTWQAGTGVPADGFRDVPDVAFPAAVEHDGYVECSGDAPCTAGTTFGTNTGGGGVVGGTSVATPNFAAILAVVEQANGGAALGNINPILYTLAQGASRSTIFHDITTGNNIVPCTEGTPNCTTGTMGYSAGVGYDQVTGLGSIDAPSLRTALSTVTAKTPTLALSASVTAPTVGTAVTFTMAVSGTGSTPTGTVQFAVDGINVGSAVTLNAGVATYAYSGFTTVATHSVTATYSGDNNYNAGTATLSLTSVQATPVVTLAASPTSPAVGASVSFTATVTGTSLTPTGTVTFVINSVSHVVTISGTTAGYTLTSGFSAAGSYTVTATYSGDANFTPLSSNLNVVVTAPTQTLTPNILLTASSTSIATAATDTFTVTATGSGVTPTGTVTVLVDGASTTTAATLTNGSATFTYTFTTAGTHTVQVSYGGDGTYKTAPSNTVTITVTSPTFSLAVTPASQSIAVNGSGTATATVTGSSTFSGTVSFGYSVSPSTSAICLQTSGTSNTVTVSQGGTGTLPLVIYTNTSACGTSGAKTLPLTTKSVAGISGWGRAGMGIVSVAGLLGCFCFRRRLRGVTLLAIGLVGLTLGAAGCGSSSSSSNGTSAGAGTYTFTLTGTSGTANATTTFTVTLH